MTALGADLLHWAAWLMGMAAAIALVLTAVIALLGKWSPIRLAAHGAVWGAVLLVSMASIDPKWALVLLGVGAGAAVVAGAALRMTRPRTPGDLGEASMLALSLAAPTPLGAWPAVLLTVPDPRVSTPDRGADALDFITSRAPLHPVDRFGDLPRDLPGWSAELDGEQLIVHTPGSGVLYEGPIARTPRWDRLLRDRGHAFLLVAPEVDADQLLVEGDHAARRRLDHAARTGKIRGGRIPITLA